MTNNAELHTGTDNWCWHVRLWSLDTRSQFFTKVTFSQLQVWIYCSGPSRTSWRPQWWQPVGIVILWPWEVVGDGRNHKFQGGYKGGEMRKSCNPLTSTTVGLLFPAEKSAVGWNTVCKEKYQWCFSVGEQRKAQSSNSKTHCCLVHTQHRKSSLSFRPDKLFTF